ncbi:MAG TPA: hypothetical protein PLQ67_05815, partial [Burkholderiaceae bacterium]|nr:hypothetical protein [Burkholderiaceae bacterium]
MNAPPSNPFQLFKPHGLHYFQGVIFNDDDNDLFFNAVAQMREAFSAALDSGKSQEFVKAFTHLTTHMLAASREKTTLYRLFEDALWRLLVYLFHLRARSRAHFCEQASVYRFELDPALLADPRAQIDT